MTAFDDAKTAALAEIDAGITLANNAADQADQSLAKLTDARAKVAALVPDIAAPAPVIAVSDLKTMVSDGAIRVTWVNPTPARPTTHVARDGVQADGGGQDWNGDIDGNLTAVTFDKLAPDTPYSGTITPAGGIPTPWSARTPKPVVVVVEPPPTPTTRTAPLGAPTGSKWLLKEYVDFRTIKAIDAEFVKMWGLNRWDGATALTETNVSTNNVSIQDDTSWSGNVRLGPGGLEMWICPQVLPNWQNASDPNMRKPYCGSHFVRRAAVLVPGAWIEWDTLVTNGGSWSGHVHYPDSNVWDGERDLSEWGNSATDPTPTENEHSFTQQSDGSWKQTSQNQTRYLGSPKLAGDGKVHVYGDHLSLSGDTWSGRLDGNPTGPDKTFSPKRVFKPWLEVGVPKGQKARTEAHLIVPEYRLWVPA